MTSGEKRVAERLEQKLDDDYLLWHDVPIQATNIGDVRALQLPIPPSLEQTEIVRRVEALFALADRIEARCTAARAQAQRLTPLVLAKAFRGELVPQDPTDEPASALLARIVSSNTAATGKNKQKAPVARKKQALKTINLCAKSS